MRDKKSILQYETRANGNGERKKRQNNENKIKNRGDNVFDGIVAINNMFSNSKVNNRSKLRITGYRNLSKQAMKEYALKNANASSIDWENTMEF